MKTKAFFIIALALIVVAGFSLTACSMQYDITYSATVGGKIDGITRQRIASGGNATTVTAVADAGYTFSGWSDNNSSPARTDRNIRSNLNVTASFERITREVFTYVYNEATHNNTIKSIELKLESLEQTMLVVPQRTDFIFDGWYSDWLFTTQVSDELGNIVIGDEIFATNSNQLFAKWLAVDAATYEILMIYVTEVSGTFEKDDGSNVTVDYKMTDTEKQVCELTSVMFGQYLNALMNGLVVFEVDNYFTTEILGREHFVQGSDAWYNTIYMLNGYDIPEISNKINCYRSVITTFCLNDYIGQLRGGAGFGSNKFAGVHMESLFGVTQQGYDLEYLFNFSNQGVTDWWEFFMQLYLHEFTHTVEMHYYNYHDTLNYYGNKYGNISQGLGSKQSGISEIEVIRLFLLNQAKVDNKIIGIPKDFWFGEIDVTVNYVSNVIDGRSGGQVKIVGDTSERPSGEDYVTMEVPFGSDIEVVALPNDGYRFVKWSDGITTATRHDTNIISYLTVRAIFERV